MSRKMMEIGEFVNYETTSRVNAKEEPKPTENQTNLMLLSLRCHKSVSNLCSKSKALQWWHNLLAISMNTNHPEPHTKMTSQIRFELFGSVHLRPQKHTNYRSFIFVGLILSIVVQRHFSILRATKPIDCLNFNYYFHEYIYQRERTKTKTKIIKQTTICWANSLLSHENIDEKNTWRFNANGSFYISKTDKDFIRNSSIGFI